MIAQDSKQRYLATLRDMSPTGYNVSEGLGSDFEIYRGETLVFTGGDKHCREFIGR
jgi:hypothetical protein